MTLLNKLMKHIVLALTTLLFAFGLNMATSQEANAGEFEINGGFGFAGMYHKNSVDYNGFTFTIGAHYRFLDWLGLGVEQDLGALFNDDDNDYNGFYGATIFGAKFIYSFGAAEIFGRLGIGAVYVNMEYVKHHIHWEWDNAWFGLRLGVGGTYYIAGPFGIGLNFDYTPSFDDDVVTHFLRLQLHLVYKF